MSAKQYSPDALFNELGKWRPNLGECTSMIWGHKSLSGYADREGVTPLMRALKRGYNSEAEGIIRQGGSVTAKDAEGRTPLHYAVNSPVADVKILELLVSYGADVNAPDNKGATPMHYAVAGQNIVATRMLALLDADIHAPDRNGMTPMKLAQGKMFGPAFVTAMTYRQPAATGEPLCDAPKAGTQEQKGAPQQQPPLTWDELTEMKAALKAAFRKVNLPGPVGDRDIHALALTSITQALLDIDTRLREQKPPKPKTGAF